MDAELKTRVLEEAEWLVEQAMDEILNWPDDEVAAAAKELLRRKLATN